MRSTDKTISFLLKAQSAYDKAIGDVEYQVVNNVEFDFSICYQPSDGFVMVDSDANNAPLDACLTIIKAKGILTHEDYLLQRI